MRLWHSSSGDRAAALHLTYLLVSAILVATSRTTSSRHADLYLKFMTEYIEGIKKHFPDFELHPNHHFAFHLRRYLIQYGPMHDWWTFPFERIIGMLQRIPTNDKTGTQVTECPVPLYRILTNVAGEIEKTIAQSFHRASNLRGSLLKADTPDALKRCQPMFDKLVDPRSGDTLMQDITDISSRVPDDSRMEVDEDRQVAEESASSWNSKKATTIPKDVRHALEKIIGSAPTHAMFTSDIKISGFIHSTQRKHVGNSQVFFSTSDSQWIVPGFIQYMFSLEHDSRQFIAVRRLLPATDKDPFSEHQLLGVQMYSNALDDIEIIGPDDVDAQFASCPLEWNHKDNIAVISLSRVSTVWSLTIVGHPLIVLKQNVDIP